MAIVYLSLGSNLGDRLSYIQQATSLLGSNDKINIVTTSSFYETEPWKMGTTNWFANAVVQITTSYTPEELLSECKKIESLLGRKPNGSGYSDRTIDIDIIFYDNLILNTPELTIPHKLFHHRAFVLVPMLEIAQDFVHPFFGVTVSKLYDQLENPEMVCLYGTRM